MIRERSRGLRALVGSIVLAIGACACAQGFARCDVEHELAHGHCLARAMDGGVQHTGWAAGEAPAGLPFCDVHNGMTFRRCVRIGSRRLARAARYPDDHPCRETLDLAQPARYAKKLDALRAMWARLDAKGVRLVALQEVFDASAVRAVLPSQWSVVTTRELAGAPSIAQRWVSRGGAARTCAACARGVARRQRSSRTVRCGRDSRSPWTSGASRSASWSCT